METEHDRLRKLYSELGNEHLLDLADDQDDLTDEARLALAHELRRRGITQEPPEDQPVELMEEPERESGFAPGIPGMFPSSASAVEQALEPAQPDKDGMGALIAFYDGIELSKACTILEDAGMDPVIESIDGDAMSGVPPRFEVWLATEDIEPAKTLLREKMGLFPPREVDGEGYSEEAATGLVGVFPTAAEAEKAWSLLAGEGIDATVAQEDEAGEWEVMCDPAEQERAVAVIAGAMGLG
jgi:hypothetical protein